MSIDTSVRNPNQAPQRMVDALLRSTGGLAAMLLMPPAAGDSTDAGQLGINSPSFQLLPLAPAQFRRVRVTMQDGQQPQYELMLSASAVQQQVAALQLISADALLTIAAGVVIAGESFCIEGWSSFELLGQTHSYRLLLRAAEPQSLTPEA